MNTIKLKIARQVADDMRCSMIPNMLMILKCRSLAEKGTRAEIGIRVCNAVMQELHVEFEKRIVNSTKSNIKFQLKEYHALILYDTLLRLPVSAEDYWRNNYRNQIIEQLDRQLQSIIL